MNDIHFHNYCLVAVKFSFVNNAFHFAFQRAIDKCTVGGFTPEAVFIEQRCFVALVQG